MLLAIVVGSGIMGDTLSEGNDAITLLGNSIATGAGLVVLITIFSPISGAHINPVVTLAFILRREVTLPLGAAFIAAQFAGGVSGTLLVHAMFDLDIIQLSLTPRAASGQPLSEGVATFGLVLTILGAKHFKPESIAVCVGLYITAAYWFTASTSFANPAVTIARMLTDSITGIRPADAPAFIIAQCLSAALATLVARWLFIPRDESRRPRYSERHEKGAASAV